MIRSFTFHPGPQERIQCVRLCKSKITMCAAYLQPRYMVEGGGRSMRAGVFYMMLSFLKNSQQIMCRSDEKLRALNSFFNLDGCVYYLTKKDTFCTLYSSCKFYAVCVKIGDTFLICKKCGNWCCTLHVIHWQNEIVRRNIQSITCLGEEKYGNRNALLLYEDGVFEDRYSDLSLTWGHTNR